MWGLSKVGVWGLFLWVSWLSCCCWTASAEVVLIGRSSTLSFSSVDANFGDFSLGAFLLLLKEALAIEDSGVSGMLYLAEPVDACSELTNKVEHGINGSSPFVLIVRGGCSFERKVRMAQEAGFKAAIVYNDEDYGPVIAMSGNSAGINIHAIFVSRSSGESLKNYAGSTDVELLILPGNDYSSWAFMAPSVLSMIALSVILVSCFFVRRRQIMWERPLSPHDREFHGMSSRLVKAMPSLIFTSVLEDNCTSETCAICLEDYSVGEKLRILPCRHKFHVLCVDTWLTSWRTFCPVCKHDARTATGEPPASEGTPLLSSTPASVASSPILSSPTQSSVPSSPAIQITRASLPQSASHTSSLASTCTQQSFRSYQQSPSGISVSHGSVDLRNASSLRSQGSSHLASPPSVALAYPSVTPADSLYMSYMPSQSNGSPSYLGHSYEQNPLHCSGSAASFSPFASTNLPPEC